MSGNIFASSTVPGIKDRDRDKQVIALWGQSYYLSRSDFTTTYWVKLMIGSTLLMIVVPIFLARLFFSAIQQPQPDPTAFLSKFYPPALRPSPHVDTSTFQLAEIPISAVLTQALATANDTRSRGLLTHALLELQNPELTTFAGPGYGVHLKEMNRGGQLEAFPDGRLPWCRGGGRYDEWGRVRGLRYAYRWISTLEEASLMHSPERSGKVQDFDLDSLLMAWPALLLERALVDDPLNPVPPGSRRNVYGEAVDRIVGKLCTDGQCEWRSQGHRNANLDDTNEGANQETEDAQQRIMLGQINNRDSRLLQIPLTNDVGSTFILPSFFAIYAVARQDTKWLVGAAEQLELYLHGPTTKPDQEKKNPWIPDDTVTQPMEAVLDLQDESDGGRSNNPWATAGVVRVLSVLEKWKPNFNASNETDDVKYEDWRNTTSVELQKAMTKVLSELREQNIDTTDVLQFCLDHSRSDSCESRGPSPELTALLIGSIYRLAQLNMLHDLSMLEWADELYNAVAKYVDSDGSMHMVTEEQAGESRDFGLSPGKDQSIVIMMWTARRDCAKVGICRKHRRPARWQRLMTFVLGSIF